MEEYWEREMRQRALVTYVLDDYRTGRSGLRRLAEDLYSLSQQFRIAPEAWTSELQAEANGLESLYAIALDRGIAHDLPEEYLRHADEAVTRVQAMLLQLDPPPDDEDGHG